MEIGSRPLVIDTSRGRFGGIHEGEVEEVVRDPTHHRRTVSFASTARSERAPIRRQLQFDDHQGNSYQMFEISTSMGPRTSLDGSEASASSALTMATSAGSTTTDPWSSGYVEEDEEEEEEAEREDFKWGEDDEELIAPKLEPTDDVIMTGFDGVAEIKDATNTAQSSEEPVTPQVKRPRGRPRKHPKPTPESQAKIAKGRSKTGCGTCRRRKKKCDEARPYCILATSLAISRLSLTVSTGMNCEKNSVKCEGYPEKAVWKSGKEKRAEEGRVVLKPYQHRIEELMRAIALLRSAGSTKLPTIQLPFLISGLETEGDRIFLHHYISRLSIIFTLEGERDSAFRNILIPMAQQHSGLMHSILALSSKHIDYTSPYGLQVLREHPAVNVQALQERSQFHQDEAFKILTSKQVHTTPGPATYAQMICLILDTLNDPSPNGSHRFHLQSYKRLIQENPPEDGESMKFIHEFFSYHIHADELIYFPQGEDIQYVAQLDDWNLPQSILQPSAVRMLGVFDGLFMYMSRITNIRNKIRQNMENKVDPVVDFRAIFAAAEIDAGLREWTPAWSAGDPRDAAGMLYKQMMWIYLWRTVFPPQTTNWKPDPHITMAVEDGIKILETIGARDPSQTLILAPAFVIGCGAFEEKQRKPIRKAIRTVKAYMEYKNTDTALEVLEEVWRLMDAKDERSWDWQAIAHRMNMDFLAT